jgi:hypothetical protein
VFVSAVAPQLLCCATIVKVLLALLLLLLLLLLQPTRQPLQCIWHALAITDAFSLKLSFAAATAGINSLGRSSKH